MSGGDQEGPGPWCWQLCPACAALRHVDDAKLLADAEIVLAAAASWGGALERCSPRLKQDPAFIRKAVTIDPWHLQHADGPARPRTGRRSSTRSRATARPSSSPLMPLGPTPKS